MGIITNYVCDVSGVSGTSKKDFVDVEIRAYSNFESNTTPNVFYRESTPSIIIKLVHADVAKKLNLVRPKKEEPAQPEVTFEGKLKALLENHVESLVQGHLENLS